MKIRAIITGASGMVGEGVLHVCLNHPDVESVLVIGRRTCGVKHEKLKELVLQNLADISSIRKRSKGIQRMFLLSRSFFNWYDGGTVQKNYS